MHAVARARPGCTQSGPMIVDCVTKFSREIWHAQVLIGIEARKLETSPSDRVWDFIVISIFGKTARRHGRL